tara:strand:- start:4710 stop:5306 length:597 start_codon:yes stop_codon:yes gene_type:complete
MKPTLQEFNPEVIRQFEGNPGVSIPGQSLTNDPKSPYPWEQPPRFVKHQEALDYIVAELLEEDRVMVILDSISKGVPISDIAFLILRQGFSKGLFNPDLMLMLAEPLMYVMMALAEKSGIEYILYEGEHYEDDEFDVDQEDEEDLPDIIKSKIPKVSKEKLEQVELPESVEQQIEEFKPSDSLLARPDEENTSLLERG